MIVCCMSVVKNAKKLKRANWLVKNNLVINLEKSKIVCPLWYTPENFGIKTYGNYHESNKNHGIRYIRISSGKYRQKFDVQ